MTDWALIVAGALVLASPVAWRLGRRRFDPFEPIVLFAAAWGAMFVARPAAILVRHDHFFWGVDVSPTMTRSLLLALLGAMSFVTVYELAPATSLARRLPRAGHVRTRVATVGALAACGLGLVALAVVLPLSDGPRALGILFTGRNDEFARALGDSSNYVGYASLLFVPAGLILAGLALRTRSRWLALGASATIALALVRLVPQGGRMALLPLIGGVFVLAFVMRGTRPRSAVLTGVAALALLSSYLILNIRDPYDDQTLGTAVEELVQRPQAVFDPLLTSADAEMVLALSAALTVVPEELSHRWGGATVGNLLTRPIPRELWPDKPRPPGHDVVATIWPHLYPGLDPAFSPLLVLYWDFGLLGVVAGMGLFGLLARLLYEWFLMHRHALAAQIIFSSSVWFVVIGARNDPVDTLVLAAFLLGPMLAILALAGRAPHDMANASSRRPRSRLASASARTRNTRRVTVYSDDAVGMLNCVGRSYDLGAPKGARGRSSDNTPIEAELGWIPSIGVYEGLEKTYAWIYDRIVGKVPSHK